jgi:hypothetical protein
VLLLCIPYSRTIPFLFRQLRPEARPPAALIPAPTPPPEQSLQSHSVLLSQQNGAAFLLPFLLLSPISLLYQHLLFPLHSAASTGIPLSGGSCTSPAYPTTCTVADGSAQYCCPSGTGCFSSATFTCYDQGPVGAYPTTASNFDCSGVVELTVDEAQALFATGELTSRALVSCYLQRIADYDNIGTFKGLVSCVHFSLLLLRVLDFWEEDVFLVTFLT